MKALFIGGTGNISTSCSRLALEKGIELTILNRGQRDRTELKNARWLTGDIYNNGSLARLLEGETFDVVANFIAFTPEHVNQDIRQFSGKCGQYIFISSASAYQKPPVHPVITESTPLCNPFWQYSRDKIACEELLTEAYRENGFPATIIRPSHTYDRVIPVAIGSWEDYTIVERMRAGKEVVIHGDGTSLWTLTHSIDFAKGLVGLMGNQQAAGHGFHITSDEILTWNQIYQAVAEAAGAELKAVHMSSWFICQQAEGLGLDWMRGNLLGDKAASVIFDNTKIKRFVPGFEATIPFREGIRKTIAWFDAHPDRIRIDKENNTLLDHLLRVYPH